LLIGKFESTRENGLQGWKSTKDEVEIQQSMKQGCSDFILACMRHSDVA
jgi:hypothetical protein